MTRIFTSQFSKLFLVILLALNSFGGYAQKFEFIPMDSLTQSKPIDLKSFGVPIMNDSILDFSALALENDPNFQLNKAEFDAIAGLSILDIDKREYGTHPEYGMFKSDGAVEILGMRDEYSKTYLFEDGTKRLAKSLHPVHFKDNQGNWITYGKKLVEHSDEPNHVGIYRSNYPIDVDLQEMSFEIALNEEESARVGTSQSIEVFDASFNLVQSASAQLGSASWTDSTVIQSNIYPSISKIFDVGDGRVQYSYVFEQVPEMLNSVDSGYIIVWEELSLGSDVEMDHVVTPFGDLEWFNNLAENYPDLTLLPIPLVKGGEDLGLIENAYAFDHLTDSDFAGLDSIAQRELKMSSFMMLPHVIKSLGNGTYQIGAVIPIEWLKSEDRSFPVSVDPIITGARGQYGNVEYNTWGCNEALTINMPANSTVQSVRSESWIWARNGAWRSEQRQRTQGPNGFSPTYAGGGNGGGFYYNYFANNMLTGTVSGNQTFRWWSYRTWTPDCGNFFSGYIPCEYCGQTYQYRYNNWTIYIDYCTPQGNQVSYGTNSWIGYVYHNNNFTNYAGYVTQANDFDQGFGGSYANYNTNGCPVYMEYMSVRYRNSRTFPCGIYRFRLGGDDGHRVSINGGSSWLGSWWYPQGWNYSHYTPWVYLNGTYNMVLEFYENGGGNRMTISTQTLTPTVSVSINQGASGTICSNSSTTLTATGNTNYGPISSYSWSGPGGYSASGTTASGITQPGTYTVTATHQCGQTGTDSYVLTVNPAPTVDAGSNINGCYGTSLIPMNNSGTDPSAANVSAVSWSGGAGTWSGSGLNPNSYGFTPSSGSGSFTATLSVTGSGACSSTTVTDTRTVTWSEVVANAGPDYTQCGTTAYNITGASASGAYSGVSWSTSVGSGSATFSGLGTISPTITPTSATGSVTMTLTVTGNGACAGTNPTDVMVMSWTAGPTANAGPDIGQCGGANAMFTGSSASTGSTVAWTLLGGGSGNGTIITGNATNPTTWGFNPSTPSGSRTVRLTVTGSGLCGSTTTTDDLVVTWDETPSVSTTTPQNSCTGTTAFNITGASASGTYSTLSWGLTGISGTASITSGGGTTSPTLTPTTTSGQYSLVLTATGSGECAGTNPTSTMTVNWDNPPTVNAGGNLAECEGNPVSMTGASISGGAYSAISWTQTGGTATGSFTTTHPTDPTLWIFTPTSAGTATFQLSVTGQGSICGSTVVTDSRTVTWDALPTVDASTDIDVCTGTASITMSGASATNFSSYAWSDGGGFGSWNQGGSIPTAQFTPSTIDGQIIALLTVTGNGACSSESVSDSRIVDWHTPPTVAITVTDNTDCQNPNGIITVTPTGGLSPYQYSNDGGSNYQVDNFFDGLDNGPSFNIQVQDANGCVGVYASNPVVLNGPPAVTPTVTVTQQNLCAGGILGEITLSGAYNGSGADYYYTLEGPSSNRWVNIGSSDPFVVDSLPNGTYDVVLADRFGCLSTTTTVSITSPPAITVTALNITDVVGCGSSGVGAIDVTASGGTGTLNFYLDSTINSPATSGTWNGLPGGSYEVLISDANACNTVVSAQINAPWIVDAGDDVFQCGAGNATLDGGIIGQFSGSCPLTCTSGCGIPSHCAAQTFNTSDEWIDRVIFNTINNTSGSTTYSNYTGISTTVLRGNTYNLQVRTRKCCGNTSWNECVTVFFDWNRDGAFGGGEGYNIGCSTANVANRSVNITIPVGASLGNTRMRVYHRYNGYPASCNNYTYGEVEDYTVNIEDVTACVPTYSWSPAGGANATATVNPGTSSTTYTLTINDGSGCVQSDDVTVYVSNESTNTSQVDVDCFGNDNGCITVSPSNGIQPYLIYGPSNEVKVFGGSMRPVTITNSSITNYTDFPAKITVPYSSGMRADFNDIRFYDANQNMLDFWIETYTLSTDATVWVKVTSMPVGNTTIYMTYGNTANTEVSNGNNVFEFFDDFDDFDGTKWTQGLIAGTNGTNWSYYGGNLQGGNIRRFMQSNTTFSGNKILETRNRGISINCNGYTPLSFWGSTANQASFLHHRCGSRVYTRANGTWQNHGSGSYLIGQWVRSMIRETGGSAIYRRYNAAGTMVLNVTRANTLVNERVRIGSRGDNWTGNQNYNAQWDWIFVRPHITIEPTFSFGAVVTSDNVFCGLAPATYNFNVVDVGGCNNAVSATITEPSAALTIDNIDVTDTWCYVNGYGELDITVSGGTPAYVYNWAGPSSYSSTNEDLTGLNSGNYNITVADDNACTATSSATVGTLVPITAPNYTWKGSTDQLWQDPTNWDCGLPDATSPVIIPAVPVGGNLPIIQNGVIGDVLNIDIQGNTSGLLDIQPGGLLRVHQ